MENYLTHVYHVLSCFLMIMIISAPQSPSLHKELVLFIVPGAGK